MGVLVSQAPKEGSGPARSIGWAESWGEGRGCLRVVLLAVGGVSWIGTHAVPGERQFQGSSASGKGRSGPAGRAAALCCFRGSSGALLWVGHLQQSSGGGRVWDTDTGTSGTAFLFQPLPAAAQGPKTLRVSVILDKALVSACQAASPCLCLTPVSRAPRPLPSFCRHLG